MSKLKVYGGLTFHAKQGKLRQLRTIVATTSQKRVAELTAESLHSIQKYWAITGNEKELEIALKNPEQVFLKINNLFVRASSVA